MHFVNKYTHFLIGSVLAPAESIRNLAVEPNLKSIAHRIAVFSAFLVSSWFVLQELMLHEAGSKETMIESFITVSEPTVTLAIGFSMEFTFGVLFYFAFIGIVKYLFRFKAFEDKIIAAAAMSMLLSVAILPLGGLSEYLSLIGGVDSLYGALIILALYLVYIIIYVREALAVSWSKSTMVVLASSTIIVIPFAIIFVAFSIGILGVDEFLS